MSDLPVRGNESPITSAIHLEFIRSVADSDENTGIQEVEAFHRSLFLNQHGRDLERARQERHLREDRLSNLEGRLEHTRRRIENEEKFLPLLAGGMPDTEPAAPWNPWDVTMFVAAAAAIVCLLVFGVFNISFNLLESGIVTFAEHPIRAYFWAALLPVGALAVKVGWDFLQDSRKRDIYLWTCLTTGVIAVLVWIGAYASIYPTLSKTAADQVATISVFDDSQAQGDFLTRMTSGGAKRIDMLLVAGQAIAEICLSAVLGMYLTQLYSKHRSVRLALNPAFEQFDGERRRLEDDVARERQALGEAKGTEAKLEHQLSVFVSYARSLFLRESALRRDRGHQKRALIQDTVEQLRSRLEALDKDSEPPSGNGDSRPPSLSSTSFRTGTA